jgi:hypothetical protein
MTRKVHLKKNPENQHSKPTIYDRLTRWFEKNNRWWIIGVLAIGLINGILSFDIKPSVDGDDTSYVLQAMNIVSTGQLPVGFRTPGYPIILALFIFIFGTNLVLLKATSLVFFLGIILSLFFVFRKRFKPMVLFPTLLFIALNPLMVRYSHQTFSEILFALLLVWAIYCFLRASETNSFLFTIFAAIITMASFYIRIIGITVVVTTVILFAMQRRWKQVGLFIIVCIILYSPIKIYEWTSGTAAFGQTSILLLKNPYNLTLGLETFGGFIERFINNIINQLNYQIPFALGLPMPPEIGTADGRLLSFPNGYGTESINWIACLGILVSTVVLIGLITPLVKRKITTTSFIGIFIMVYIAFISLALQNLFATPRMLVSIIPYLFFGIFEGFRWLGNRWAKVTDAETVSAHAKTAMLIACCGLMFAGVTGTKHAVDENYPILKANLGGNKFAGFTEDWVNYLRASLWIKEQLPAQTTGIICRKPELFLIYAGNYSVYGTYKIDETNPDSIVTKWKSLKMTHLLYDNFQWSSTLRRYVQPVAEKYPQMFELVHQEGSQSPSYIFHLNYLAATDSAVLQKGRMR